MQRSRGAKRAPIVPSSSDSEDDVPLKKLQKPLHSNVPVSDKPLHENDSSSESDIENYLQPIDKIDLSSSFFQVQKKSDVFDNIEKDIFAGVTRLSESDSDEEMNEVDLKASKEEQKSDSLNKPSSSLTSSGPRLNFQQLEEYTRKIEEAKKHVEKYNAKKKAEENNMDISNLLAAGESKQITLENIKPEDLHSSDFESCDSEQEDWEEVKHKDSQEMKEKRLVPKDGLQIMVDMPDPVRKKKGVDLLAAMKRRLNRIRKENQVYVHKVHLLCWIAHGNYVNGVLNNSEILSSALSLLPSEQCYPADRPDLGYLEQIVQWYKKSINLIEKIVPKNQDLIKSLQSQIATKQASNKKMLVYIFIAILRSLGIQCRLVLSFRVEPLRPPPSDLHSLAKDGTQTGNKGNPKVEEKGKSITSKVKDKTSGSIPNKSKKQPLKKEKIADKISNVNPVPKQNPKIKNETQSRAKLNKTSTGVNTATKASSSRSSSTKEKENDEKPRASKKVLKENSEVSTSKLIVKKEKNARSKSADNNVNEKSTEKAASNCLNVKEVENKKRSKSVASSSSVNANKLTVKKEKNTRSASTNIKGNEKSTSTNLNAKKVENKQLKDIASTNKLTTKKEKNACSKTVDTKINEKSIVKTNGESLNIKKDENKQRSKSASNSIEKITHSKSQNSVKKDVIKLKIPRKGKQKEVAQLDGANSTSEEDITFDFVPQLDGADDSTNKSKLKNKKPNLKNLNAPAEGGCKVKKHPNRLKSTAEACDSADEFRPRSPLTKKNESPRPSQSRKVNLHRLKDHPTMDKSRMRSFGSSSPKKQLDIKSDIINLIKGRIAEQKHVDRGRMVTKRKSAGNESDSDSDYMPNPVKKKYHDSDSDLDYFVPKPKVKERVRVHRVGTKILSSDSDPDKSGKKKKMGNDVWVEVFLESEEKWISVDVVKGQVHCVNELHTRATHPVSYIVAWSNDNSIKDVTRRYCTNFNTITRKLRVDAKWWDESIKPFLGKYTARDKEEDDDLNRQQLDQPLPKSIAEYKNHPLYVLRRHLLKFEDIYPPNIQPIGYIRSEPVYPRNCVYVCRSRDIWLKEAKVVKPGEKPYKIVKARPKYDKLSNQVITDQMLEIFGEWQTMDYEPPTAENGVVPRNAFGNVELFKPCMLPKKTVHLKLPGLNKICRRMDIDCASAIVGFDFHCGWSHPMYDGFVVCEEFADVLVAAWELEQEDIERKENEKIEKRVYGNWKKLIKGLLIRERLKARYDFGGASTSGGGGKDKKKVKGATFCTKKRRVYSDSESESDKT